MGDDSCLEVLSGESSEESIQDGRNLLNLAKLATRTCYQTCVDKECVVYLEHGVSKLLLLTICFGCPSEIKNSYTVVHHLLEQLYILT